MLIEISLFRNKLYVPAVLEMVSQEPVAVTGRLSALWTSFSAL